MISAQLVKKASFYEMPDDSLVSYGFDYHRKSLY